MIRMPPEIYTSRAPEFALARVTPGEQASRHCRPGTQSHTLSFDALYEIPASRACNDH